MATCGITEPEARAKYGEDKIKVYTSKFTNLFFGHWQVLNDYSYWKHAKAPITAVGRPIEESKVVVPKQVHKTNCSVFGHLDEAFRT